VHGDTLARRANVVAAEARRAQELFSGTLDEDAPLRPRSLYATTKAAQDLLGYTYFRSYDMKVIRTRMFAYLNPRRRDLFATSFAFQVARIETGLQKELLHGNLESVRTLIDVRDAIVRDGAAKRWALDADALLAKIDALSYAQCASVLDVAERHWAAADRGEAARVPGESE